MKTRPAAFCGRFIAPALVIAAVAAPFQPYVLRIAAQGPGRTAIIELDHFETKASCIATRDAFLAQMAETKGTITTPDGLKSTVLGARCAVPGTAA